MSEKLKYFILNNAYDFGRGICENMKVCDNELRFSSEKISGIGRYMTRIFDSGDRGTIWHRLLINIENCSAGDLRITVFATDKQEFRSGSGKYTLEGVLHDESMSIDRKLELFAPFEAKKITGAKDALLHDVSGRYLWIYSEVYGISGNPAAIKDLRVYLPADSWIDLLPQIYRKSDRETGFLERYLAIFQTMYEETDHDIKNIASRFDPECAESGFLEWLAEWLDISDSSIWSEEQLRKLLLMAVSLYRTRGTRESLSKVIELYTGEKPFIIETFSLRQYIGTESYERTLLPMYGSDPYKVIVLVRNEVIRTDNDVDILWRISREMMPVTVELELKVLDPYIFLDKYSYLGINSYLGKCRNAALDGKTQITFSTLGEKK